MSVSVDTMNQQQIEQGAWDVFDKARCVGLGGLEEAIKRVVAYMQGLQGAQLTVTFDEAKKVRSQYRVLAESCDNVTENIRGAINTVLAQRARPAEASSEHKRPWTPADNCQAHRAPNCRVCREEPPQPAVQPFVYEEAQPVQAEDGHATTSAARCRRESGIVRQVG